MPSRVWLETARAACPDDPAAQLRHVIAAIADQNSEPGYRGCPPANASVEFPDRTHPVRVAVDELKADYLELLTELVSQLPVRLLPGRRGSFQDDLYTGAYARRRRETGATMYGALGIGRDEHEERAAFNAERLNFYGA
ncbi:TetR family transcriptional regulator C-terminal domain-containing protein [Streptomyces monomycini]|uniref:TetR family transcriptional regulator C-terminal domain-containing protein n=1 Tax=Streptomyces monomycini TaxID=371720 RepID=UPI000AE4259F|nr:hypothetical protein [Streptomyces monomycini]